jgi:hypothetical protein
VTRWKNDKLHYILTSARLIGKREYDDALFDLPDVPAILDEQLGSGYATSSPLGSGQGVGRVAHSRISPAVVTVDYRSLATTTTTERKQSTLARSAPQSQGRAVASSFRPATPMPRLTES